MEKVKNKRILTITTVGLMAALVYIGNFMQFQIPSAGTITRIHLGNSMCLLAGLLFSGSTGGLSSGIGAALFDLFTPAYVLSAPYTFISKFAMGYVAGKLNRRGNDGKIHLSTTVIAAVLGQIVYIILYLAKTFITQLMLGNAVETALSATATNAVVSCVNAAVSVVIAVPLYVVLKKALVRTPFKEIINPEVKSKGYFNPVTVGLIISAFATTTIYAMQLSAQSKIDVAQADEKAALEEKLSDYEDKLKTVYDELGIGWSEEKEEQLSE